VIDASVVELAPTLGTSAACRALSASRVGVYRRRTQRPASPSRVRTPSARALTQVERITVLDALHSDRFIDDLPAQVYTTLVDEGTYQASQSTMYRLAGGQR
jgi:putative transposase